jgi:predicted HTH transcriptional regulator
VQTVDRLRSLFLQDSNCKPVFLLGAGASLRSGIPLSEQVVGLAAKWAFCRANGSHPDDPNVRRSDWLRWLQRHPWYKIDTSASDNYSEVIHHLLQPREDRKEFFLRLINPSVPASRGYEDLLDLMDQHRIETVLTTNFDRVLPNLHVMRRRPHHLEVIRTPADYIKFSTSPTHPQLIYLHGSVEHYSDQNLLEEVQRLNDELVLNLTPLLRDHPLIVIGYRGAEPSITQHLLADQVQRTSSFRRGIYWCILPNDKVHPAVTGLADRLAGNLQFVEISGFDETMQTLAATCAPLPRPVSVSARLGSLNDSQVGFDMRLASGDLQELDWGRIELQIIAYCRKMQIDVPTTVSREWLTARLEALDLVRHTESGLCPTNAGYLLFALRPTNRIPSAACTLALHGEEERVVEGNLWSQMDMLIDLFATVNQPFRLKSAVSDSVYPYPPMALKELLVNALVHRAYDQAQQLRIDIDPKFIRFTNPGGLVDAVFQQVNTRLQEQIELGTRGITGYRNPVIADLFYGAGAMDKEGSGLPDVHSQVMQNEGKVFFGPVDDANKTFRALIYRRQEEADTTTRTAAPAVSKSRFFANLLQVLTIPEHLWRAQTECANGTQVLDRVSPSMPPPFGLKRSTELFTFSDLSEKENPLRQAIKTSSVTVERTTELLSTPEGRRNIVELLNRSLYRFLESRLLLVDGFKRRCYFGRTDEGPRVITYQASFRQATRTVTKPVISKRTEKILYWQHESLSFQFQNYRNEWAICILPGYVFTKDGRYELLHYLKVGALATRKAARDFNLQVYNDLVFWTWVLAGGNDSFDVALGDDRTLSVRGLLLGCELASPPVADITIPPDLLKREDAQLARLEQAIEDEVESDLAVGNEEVGDAD